MSAGDILKYAGLIIEEFTVQPSEDIEKGEIVIFDATGIIPAPQHTGDNPAGPYFMALDAHDYSEASTAGTGHLIRCVVKGYVDVQKIDGSGAAYKGQWVEVSATTGEVKVYNYSENLSAKMVGTAMETTVNGDTTQKMRLG